MKHYWSCFLLLEMHSSLLWHHEIHEWNYKENIPFLQRPLCQVSFDTITITLRNSAIFVFPTPNQEYALFTYSSKHRWSGVLILERTTTVNGKSQLYTLIYVLVEFVGSQKKLATLSKEDYAILSGIQKILILSV